MSNIKFLKQVKSFAQCLDHTYDIEKFKLQKSYSQSLLLTAEKSGSEGGNCWDEKTSEYERSDKSIMLYLEYSLLNILHHYFDNYLVPEYKKIVKEHISDNSNAFNYLDYTSDDSDYYGNYTNTAIYEFKIYPLFKKLISEDDFQIFKSYLSNEKNKINKIYNDKKLEENIQKNKIKINSFEYEKLQKFNTLQEELKKHENIVISLKKDIENFDRNKNQELQNLLNEKNILNNQ